MTIWGNQLHQFNHRSEVNIQKYFHINATNHPKCVQKMYLMCFLHIIHWQKIYRPIWGNSEIRPVFRYTCQLLVSRLRAENFNLMPTHAYGPNSHAWMKNVSYNSLNWNTFLKDVNLHQFKKFSNWTLDTYSLRVQSIKIDIRKPFDKLIMIDNS